MLAETHPLELLGPAPCDNCRHRHRCASTGDACLAFREFYKGASEAKWRLQPTQPREDIGVRMGFRLKTGL